MLKKKEWIEAIGVNTRSSNLAALGKQLYQVFIGKYRNKLSLEIFAALTEEKS